MGGHGGRYATGVWVWVWVRIRTRVCFSSFSTLTKGCRPCRRRRSLTSEMDTTWMDSNSGGEGRQGKGVVTSWSVEPGRMWWSRLSHYGSRGDAPVRLRENPHRGQSAIPLVGFRSRRSPERGQNIHSRAMVPSMAFGGDYIGTTTNERANKPSKGWAGASWAKRWHPIYRSYKSNFVIERNALNIRLRARCKIYGIYVILGSHGLGKRKRSRRRARRTSLPDLLATI